MPKTTDEQKPKTVLITGCSPGGIGHALAKECHSRGLRVFATGRTASKISDLHQLGIECLELIVDDHESVKQCHATVIQSLAGNGLDYLVNNAGRCYYKPAVDEDIQEAKDLFNTNYFGVVDINSTFLPQLLASRGTIINIGSVASELNFPWFATYNASKAALCAYSNTLRYELAPFGVRVRYICTGNIDTPISTRGKSQAQLPAGSIYEPIRPFFEGMPARHSNGQDPAAFARELAGIILGGRSWWWNDWFVWTGELARTVAILQWFNLGLPFDLWSPVANRLYGLNPLWKASKSGRSSG